MMMMMITTWGGKRVRKEDREGRDLWGNEISPVLGFSFLF